MAQHPKPEIREAIQKAAAEAFAHSGFEHAALGDIVKRAGTSIGNLYKYFSNKDELFADFIPRGFTTELTNLIRAQVEALGAEPTEFSFGDDHPYRRASEDLLAFMIAHRERVVFLLLRAQGTKHEPYASEVVRLRVKLALEYVGTAYPIFAVTPASKRALTRIYKGFVTALGTILAEERSEHALREAITLHTSYHLPGLRAFFVPGLPGEKSL